MDEIELEEQMEFEFKEAERDYEMYMNTVEGILEEREATHGDFGKNAATAQMLKNVVRNSSQFKDLSFMEQEAIDNILQKIARACNGKPAHKDHWVDIAGYATLISRRL